MKPRRIKLPDGSMVIPKPDPFEALLANIHAIPQLQLNTTDSTDQPVMFTQGYHRQYYTTNFDILKLRGLIVTLLGAGSVSSHLSYFLGPAQLVQNVIDPKNVELRHTQGGRTIYDPNQVGLRKVDALKQKLESNHIGTKIRPYPYDAAEIPDNELKFMFSHSWLVIIALDDPEQILRVSDLAYPTVELIQVAMHAGGKSGHIAISMPYVTPCLRCTLNVKDSRDIHQLDAESANSLDIVTVAQQAARIAIDLMYSKVTGQNITRWDPSKNLIYIANTRQELSPEGPGIKFEDSQKRPGCPICNNQ